MGGAVLGAGAGWVKCGQSGGRGRQTAVHRARAGRQLRTVPVPLDQLLLGEKSKQVSGIKSHASRVMVPAASRGPSSPGPTPGRRAWPGVTGRARSSQRHSRGPFDPGAGVLEFSVFMAEKFVRPAAPRRQPDEEIVTGNVTHVRVNAQQGPSWRERLSAVSFSPRELFWNFQAPCVAGTLVPGWSPCRGRSVQDAACLLGGGREPLQGPCAHRGAGRSRPARCSRYYYNWVNYFVIGTYRRGKPHRPAVWRPGSPGRQERKMFSSRRGGQGGNNKQLPLADTAFSLGLPDCCSDSASVSWLVWTPTSKHPSRQAAPPAACTPG